jgi:hypothetical protein
LTAHLIPTNARNTHHLSLVIDNLTKASIEIARFRRQKHLFYCGFQQNSGELAAKFRGTKVPNKQ